MSNSSTRARARIAVYARRRRKHRKSRSSAHASVKRYTKLIASARRVIAREGSAPPRIIYAEDLGLRFRMPDGMKGAIFRGAGHYSAGENADTDEELVALAKQWHAHHQNIGGSGIAYEAIVGDHGTILMGNPTHIKSRAVGLNNTGMISLCSPGGPGDRLDPRAMKSMKWLLANWHTPKIRMAHRIDRPASTLDWRGHNEWPNNPTACPGTLILDYRKLWKEMR